MVCNVHIDVRMNLRSALLFVSLLSIPVIPVATGCAASAADDDGDTGGSALSSPETSTRSLVIAAVRARAEKDFAGSTALKGYKLVFVVNKLESNATKAFFTGHIQKRDAAGKDHELTTADYKGTEFAEYIAEGFFDGPNVVAGLEKVNGTWKIATRPIEGDAVAEASEAYGIGATDVFWYGWDETYGLERSWLGIYANDEVDGG